MCSERQANDRFDPAPLPVAALECGEDGNPEPPPDSHGDVEPGVFIFLAQHDIALLLAEHPGEQARRRGEIGRDVPVQPVTDSVRLLLTTPEHLLQRPAVGHYDAAAQAQKELRRREHPELRTVGPCVNGVGASTRAETQITTVRTPTRRSAST